MSDARTTFIEQVEAVIKAGFNEVTRLYRRNWSWFFLNWLTGTEILLGRKS